MKYSDMLYRAKENGNFTDKMMKDSIESIDDLLCFIKEKYPDKYWEFMREQHAIMNNNHYTEDFAKYDVDQIHYIDKDGKNRYGAHWSVEEIEKATIGLSFPVGTTKWDKYVAFNSMYADLCKNFDEGQILNAAYLFYFCDEDAPEGKIWKYICSMR